MSFKFTVSDIIPAKPRAIYDAWLDSKAHGLMSGGKAKASAKVGAAFTAWDNYISGTNLELMRGKRIVQSWRSAEFAAGDQEPRGVRLCLGTPRTRAGLEQALARVSETLHERAPAARAVV